MNLDPRTLSQLALIRQQEILERAAIDRQGGISEWPILHHLGRFIAAVGHRIIQIANAAPATKTPQAAVYSTQELDAYAK